MIEDSIFEYLERTKAVDYTLGVLAIVGPLIVAAILRWGQGRAFVENHRPDWWLGLVAGPLVYVLWRVYNAIMDAFGLDSVYALVLNASIFLCVGLALALARTWLWRSTRGAPPARISPQQRAATSDDGPTADLRVKGE
ncbi:MAG: hypothetical protein ACPL7D_03175 [Candidatus Sumerlaeaceae bacterium]|jgi:hypothetical protein